MTFDQESSPPGRPQRPKSPEQGPGSSELPGSPQPRDLSTVLADLDFGVESTGGAFHPHMIEVQDFESYGLIVDIRPRADYEDDHIPGAVNIEPPAQAADADPLRGHAFKWDGLRSEDVPVMELPAALGHLAAPLADDERILVYCGRGGLDSFPVALALRQRRRAVDVLAGGWINYRRWVQAGLLILPRLVQFRVIGCSLGSLASQVLGIMRNLGHQVIDVWALAGWQPGRLDGGSGAQPAQALFETLLVDALRHLDGRQPVWIPDLGPQAGSLRIPASMIHAQSIAPVARLEAPPAARLRQWQSAGRDLTLDPKGLLEALSSLHPPPAAELLSQWHQLAARGPVERLLDSVLRDHFDVCYAEQFAMLHPVCHFLQPLIVASFEPAALAKAVLEWMPTPE